MDGSTNRTRHVSNEGLATSDLGTPFHMTAWTVMLVNGAQGASI